MSDLPPIERRKTDLFRDDLMVRMTNMEQAHSTMKAQLDANTKITSETKDGVDKLTNDLSGVVLLSKQIDGTLSLAQGFGRFAVWVAKVSAMVLILWAIIKYVVLEALKKPA